MDTSCTSSPTASRTHGSPSPSARRTCSGRPEYFAVRGPSRAQFLSEDRSDAAGPGHAARRGSGRLPRRAVRIRDVCPQPRFPEGTYTPESGAWCAPITPISRTSSISSAGDCECSRRNGTPTPPRPPRIFIRLSTVPLGRRVAALADAILPICQWEADHYSGRLAAAEKISTF